MSDPGQQIEEPFSRDRSFKMLLRDKVVKRAAVSLFLHCEMRNSIQLNAQDRKLFKKYA